jgi:hypothetical protein
MSLRSIRLALRGYIALLYTPRKKRRRGRLPPDPKKSIQQVLVKLDLPGSILGFPVCRTSVVSPNGEIDDAENAFNAAIIVGKQIMYEVDKCFVIGGLTRFGRAGFRAEK